MNKQDKLDILDEIIRNYIKEKKFNKVNKLDKPDMFFKGCLVGALDMCDWELEEITKYIFINNKKTKKVMAIFNIEEEKFETYKA